MDYHKRGKGKIERAKEEDEYQERGFQLYYSSCTYDVKLVLTASKTAQQDQAT